jgi:serine phosphatase RsbU (regulator of sigma subunit)
MQKNKTTIFRQLTRNIIVPMTIAVLLFSVISYYLNYKKLQEDYAQERKQIEQQSIDLLGIYDIGLSAHETPFASRMESISNKLVHEYFKNTSGIDTVDLYRISKEAGLDTSKEFIYIIDEHAVIINTTFKKDLHLDFSKRDTAYCVYLNNIREKRLYVCDRFTNEEITHKVKKYSFQATEDGKYAIELGFGSVIANQMWELVKEKVNQISKTFPEIQKIDLLTAIPKAKNENVFPELDSVYKATVRDKQSRHAEIMRDGKKVSVDFFFVKMLGTKMFEGYVVQIISNDLKEKELMYSEIKKSVLIFLVTIIPLLLIVFFRARKLTSPIIQLTSKAKNIAGGNLSERVEISGNNEISELSETFNKMVTELQESYEGLEQKVKDRTAEIENQKHIIEEKNKEVRDSINYAKRLQEAILPSVSEIKSALPDSFMLYLPKDIVAGDFYWFENSSEFGVGSSERKDNSELHTPNSTLLLFAVADSTGHGVPGAMVSVVCSNALNRTVKEFGIHEPGKILDKTRELILETFSKSNADVKDGMDISLVSVESGVWSSETSLLNFSGANNSLWIIRKGELIELRADRQPVGKTEMPKPFTNHVFELQRGDSFYLFTDGFTDQFGGEKGKKFKAANLKKLLLSIQDKTMDEQHGILLSEFENWRGTLEQVDDVCVMGVRV